MDREKVIADIEEQIAWIRDNDFHKFPGWGHAVLAMKDALELLKEQEEVKPQDAEMLIIHNGGAEEYVKDIESIVLLARKDYDIVYCGKFSEGR